MYPTPVVKRYYSAHQLGNLINYAVWISLLMKCVSITRKHESPDINDDILLQDASLSKVSKIKSSSKFCLAPVPEEMYE